MAYRILAWLLRVATRVFFRQIEVVGLEHVPLDGAVIFAGNHPNSLIDPILIIATCGRKVHFAAKDTLFKGRVMRALLGGLGAVPIKRRDDHASGADNQAAFAAMFDVLGRGDAIGIFPEGLSHDESQLARLKTGAARLALGGAQRSNRPVTIVPCGLTFIHPKRFRSRVLVQYGAPLTIAPEIVDTPDEARTITDEIGTSLRRLTVNAPDWDTVRALDVVRRLYQPQEISIEDRVELARRFNAYYAQVASDPRVVELMSRVRAYQDKLDEVGVTDRELARDLSKLEVLARVFRHFVLVAFWLPLTIPGAPLHLPPLALARLGGGRLSPRKDVIATTKLVLGLAVVLVAYAATIAVLWWKHGVWWAFAAAVVLPLSGWATLRVLDRLRLVRRGLGVLFRRLRFRREVAQLRRERAVLVADVIATVDAIKPPDVVPLFATEGRESRRARRDADLDDALDRRAERSDAHE
jgi:glycerol-3-phosphate O-acyltransferase / dihydroxyacetone phosphate acyltransferase